MAREFGRGRALVKRASRDPKLPWGEAEDALAIAERLTPQLEYAALRIVWLHNPPDAELSGLSERADAIEKKLNELVVAFTPTRWNRLEGGVGTTVGAVSLVMSLANPLALVVSAVSFLFTGNVAIKWVGTESMRLRLKSRLRDVEEAADIIRLEAVRRGL